MTYTTLFQRWFGVVWRRDVMTSYQPKNVEPALKCLLGTFYKRQNWYKKRECWFAALISMERFRMFKDFFTGLFSIKAFLLNYSRQFLYWVLDAFLQNCLSVSESSIKTKFRQHWTLFVIFFTSAVICKQKLLHGSEILQYIQIFKCYNVDQNHFRKDL